MSAMDARLNRPKRIIFNRRHLFCNIARASKWFSNSKMSTFVSSKILQIITDWSLSICFRLQVPRSKPKYVFQVKVSKANSHLVEGGAGVFDSDHLELGVPTTWWSKSKILAPSSTTWNFTKSTHMQRILTFGRGRGWNFWFRSSRAWPT